jgi:serine phosphatase RsbU (regulator of sigma subunit)
VRYLLVLRGAILLDMLAVGLSVTAVLTYIFYRTNPPGIVIGLVSAAVAILAWKVSSRFHHNYLRPLIDRHFFRQSYDSQQVITELTASLRTVTSLPMLLELVATKLQAALQSRNVTIFLQNSGTGNYDCSYSHDFSEADGLSIRSGGIGSLSKSLVAVEQASDNGQPVEVDPLGFLNGRSDNGLSEANRGILREVEATLLTPLSAKGELLGVISLGPRLGDFPFSREDKRLLMSVSAPATFAIENARLVERMVAEARRLQEMEVDHRRKTEELAFARQLQLSMLPTHDLRLGKVEIIGKMRTATEVGGDYYDFIEMTDDRICVAVGDATGHGMAAGLVVGMVKMGLIHGLHRLNGHTNVKLLVEDLNRSLKQSLSQRGMGMCLGAAILNPATLRVEVISNGMPAPYHYRAATRQLTAVSTIAPPLGFLRQVSVRPVEMQLRDGDALIWLSDGFEERLNPENQIWGGEQIERTLQMICGQGASAEDIARRMIEACDDAAEGRTNDDDMTIVVAKVKEGAV